MSGNTTRTTKTSQAEFRIFRTHVLVYGAPGLSTRINIFRRYEIEFPCKPTLVSRRPCVVAPYQYRLDWNIWFIGFPPHENMLYGRERWLFSFLLKLLDNDAKALSLVAQDCGSECINTWLLQKDFPRPKQARVEMFHYWFARDANVVEPKDPDFVGKMRTRGKDPFPQRGVKGVATEDGRGLWWNRAWSSTLIPPVGKEELQHVRKQMGQV